LRPIAPVSNKRVLPTTLVGFLLRIVLLFNDQTAELGFTAGERNRIFLWGSVNGFTAAGGGNRSRIAPDGIGGSGHPNSFFMKKTGIKVCRNNCIC